MSVLLPQGAFLSQTSYESENYLMGVKLDKIAYLTVIIIYRSDIHMMRLYIFLFQKVC